MIVALSNLTRACREREEPLLLIDDAVGEGGRFQGLNTLSCIPTPQTEQTDVYYVSSHIALEKRIIIIQRPRQTAFAGICQQVIKVQSNTIDY